MRTAALWWIAYAALVMWGYAFGLTLVARWVF